MNEHIVGYCRNGHRWCLGPAALLGSVLHRCPECREKWVALFAREDSPAPLPDEVGRFLAQLVVDARGATESAYWLSDWARSVGRRAEELLARWAPRAMEMTS
jgi:hypothetical protein